MPGESVAIERALAADRMKHMQLNELLPPIERNIFLDISLEIGPLSQSLDIPKVYWPINIICSNHYEGQHVDPRCSPSVGFKSSAWDHTNQSC